MKDDNFLVSLAELIVLLLYYCIELFVQVGLCDVLSV
jgi:hypothetical protein